MPSLILSGNEVTDALRALGIRGDGLAAPNGVGVYEPFTDLLKNTDLVTDLTYWNASNYVASNLQANPGFESGIGSWSSSGANATVTQDATHVHGGAQAGKIVTTVAGYGIRNNGIAATSGQQYTMQVWAWGENGVTYTMQWVRQDFNTVITSATFVGTGAWQQVTALTCTAPATETIYFFCKAMGAASAWWFDDALCVNGSAQYLTTSNGAIQVLTDAALPVNGGKFVRYTVTQKGGWGSYFDNVINSYWSGWTPPSQFDTLSKYTISFWARVPAGATNPLPFVHIGDATSLNFVMPAQSFTPDATFKRFSFTFTPALAGNLPVIFISIGGSTSLGVLDVGGIQITKHETTMPYEPSSKTTFGARGACGIVAPSSVVGSQAAQLWVVARVRLNAPYNAAPVFRDYFRWSSIPVANTLCLQYRNDLQMFQVSRRPGNDRESAVQSFVAKSKKTLAAAFTATQIGIGVDGASLLWSNNSNTNPTDMTPTFQIGWNDGNQRWCNDDFLWFAMGIGSLTDAYFAALNALGDTPPDYNSLPADAQMTMIWKSVDGRYMVPTPIGTATESEAAFALGKIKAKSFAQVAEADSALSLQKLKGKLIGTATEQELQEAVRRMKAKALGIADEIDNAGSVQWFFVPELEGRRGRILSVASAGSPLLDAAPAKAELEGAR